MFLLKLFLMTEAVILPLVIIFSKKDITIGESISLCCSVVTVFCCVIIKKLTKTNSIIGVSVILWNLAINFVFFFIKRKKKKEFVFDKEYVYFLVEHAIFFCELKERKRIEDFYLYVKTSAFYDEKKVKKELVFLNAVAESYGVKTI